MWKTYAALAVLAVAGAGCTNGGKSKFVNGAGYSQSTHSDFFSPDPPRAHPRRMTHSHRPAPAVQENDSPNEPENSPAEEPGNDAQDRLK